MQGERKKARVKEGLFFFLWAIIIPASANSGVWTSQQALFHILPLTFLTPGVLLYFFFFLLDWKIKAGVMLKCYLFIYLFLHFHSHYGCIENISICLCPHLGSKEPLKEKRKKENKNFEMPEATQANLITVCSMPACGSIVLPHFMENLLKYSGSTHFHWANL